MPDNETPDGDALEQQQDLQDAAGSLAGGQAEVALEAPEADAVDQQTPAARDSGDGDLVASSSLEVDEGDLAESSREVGYDDEDYR